MKVPSLDHELVLRRHATGLRSQHGNMDDTIIVNGKCFIICIPISCKSEPYTVLSQSTGRRSLCVCQHGYVFVSLVGETHLFAMMKNSSTTYILYM